MNAHYQAKVDANRKNARKSTGPRTPEGKARSSRNATRHGLCTGLPLMADEDSMKQDFDLLLADLREEHQPDGPTEDILVFKMASAFFHTYRASILLAERLDYNDAEDREKQVALFLRYQTTADRSFNKNLQDLRKLQRERQQENAGSLEEVGFVSQNVQPEPAAEPEKPVAEPAPPPPPPDFHPTFAQMAGRMPFPPRPKAA